MANHEKQERKSTMNKNDSGSEYHKMHAGNVEGYGEPYPTATDLGNKDEKNPISD
ncbi:MULTISPECIES: hypothetical protein [Metabacillus]|uniref:DUF4021 domain-containing protein n=1 Tax=Metabacillus rhizolycopersici TaxID=2875709 RepID=A0ABS7UZJ0_9BACI|nr:MULTISPECIES: hypothetical protein [Metabacillus]MBZ5753742.1 hypothetical protein [Metabacillus rhizolycopersici]MCM3654623.1 hypothetical protein [Metabacillus litoralis]